MGACVSLNERDESSGPSLLRRLSWRGSRWSLVRRRMEEQEEVQRIPGRMCSSGASDAASLFTQQGKKEVNQDAMIVWENFGSRDDTVFCGVFDGHGTHGHMIATTVRDILPLELFSNWKGKEYRVNYSGSTSSEASSSAATGEDARVYADIEERYKNTRTFHSIKNSLLRSFRIMDKTLKKNRDIDCIYSGTTAVTLVKQGQELVLGNVGDSRAVLGTRDENNSLIAVQLTVDLKPNLSSEAERIRKSKGRIFALMDEPNVARVWLPKTNTPGLAMTRALGDFCLKDFGLISVPDITYRHITARDEFVVMATDGVWDVLSNQEVVDIVASSSTERSSAAQLVVESAVEAWEVKYPTSKTDDCAVVCLFLNSDAFDTSSKLTTNKHGNSSNAAMEAALQWHRQSDVAR